MPLLFSACCFCKSPAPFPLLSAPLADAEDVATCSVNTAVNDLATLGFNFLDN